MDDVDHQILWEVKTVKMSVLHGVNTVILILAVALSVIPNPNAKGLAAFGLTAGITVLGNTYRIFELRYKHDFRYSRSPYVRAGLGKSIAELKQIEEHWGEPQ